MDEWMAEGMMKNRVMSPKNDILNEECVGSGFWSECSDELG
jgi:hypothetical protein